MIEVALDRPQVSVFTVPTEQPESDGTLQWDSVTVVVAEVGGGDERGVGYTYADPSTAAMIEHTLADVVSGCDAMATGKCWWAMVGAIRNLGWPGTSATAISALDVALADLKAKLLGVSLADLLGRVRDRVPIYGSGGLTSYSERELCEQLGGWVGDGISRVKMKVGRDARTDPSRVAAAREAIGADAGLFVEYFHTHARAEEILFDGVIEPRDGCLEADRSAPGLGITLRGAELDRYRV